MRGVFARSFGPYSNIRIRNSGDVWGTAIGDAAEVLGIFSYTTSGGNDFLIHNSGDMRLTANGAFVYARGIQTFTAFTSNNATSITNSGDLWVMASGFDPSRVRYSGHHALLDRHPNRHRQHRQSVGGGDR